MPRVSPSLRNLVRQRANDICEYCKMPQQFYRSSFQPDHIIAEVHGGPTKAHNLCWACYHWKSHSYCLHF
jgi:hypothetical protein